MLVRLDIWEKGNISLLQLSEKLRGALRHALCDAVMEFLVLPAPLCMETTCPLGAMDLEELSSAGESSAGAATLSPQTPSVLRLACGSLAVWGELGLGGLGGKKVLSPLQAVLCDVSGKMHYRSLSWKRCLKVCSLRMNLLCWVLLRALSLLASHSGVHGDTISVAVGSSGESDSLCLHRRPKEDHVGDQGPGHGHWWSWQELSSTLALHLCPFLQFWRASDTHKQAGTPQFLGHAGNVAEGPMGSKACKFS